MKALGPRVSKSVAVTWLLAFGFILAVDSVSLARLGAWPVVVLFALFWLTLVGLFLAVSHWGWLYPRLPRWITGVK